MSNAPEPRDPPPRSPRLAASHPGASREAAGIAGTPGPVPLRAQRLADRPVVWPVVGEAVRRAVAAIRDAQARRRREAAWGLDLEHAADGEWADRASAELVRLVAQLRASITVLACRLWDDGVPVEQLIPRVKALVREAEAADGYADASDTLTAQVVRWTVEMYYDQPELRSAPRFF